MGLSNVDQRMLLIQCLDGSAVVGFSAYTRAWYVSAHIEIGGVTLLRSASGVGPSPEAAIDAYFEDLTSLDTEHYLVTRVAGIQRRWHWNGAGFKEVPYSEASRAD